MFAALALLAVASASVSVPSYFHASVAAIRASGGFVSEKLGRFDDDERGVRSVERIEAGELLLAVPDALVLRRADAVADLGHRNASRLSAHGALARRLLRLATKHQDSDGSQLNALDRALSTRLASAFGSACVSGAFSVEAAKLLSYASGEHLKRVRGVYKLDRALLAAIEPPLVANAPLFDRVYCYVLSHALRLAPLAQPRGDGDAFPDVLAPPALDFALVPGFDLFGHSLRDNTVSAFEDGSWTLRTRLAYNADSPITLRYGALANVQLLMQYGVVLDTNPYDVLHIDMAPMPTDPNDAFKRSVISTHFGPYAARHYARGGSTGFNRTAVVAGLTKQALASLRLVTLPSQLVSSIVVGRIFSGQAAGPLLSEGNTWLVVNRGCEQLAASNSIKAPAKPFESPIAKASFKMRKQEFELAKHCERISHAALKQIQEKIDARIAAGMAPEVAAASSV